MKTCVDCGGSGYLICIDWYADGYNDYPGTYGSFKRIGNPADMRKHWNEPCKMCAGTGWVHYDSAGRLRPGRQPEFV